MVATNIFGKDCIHNIKMLLKEAAPLLDEFERDKINVLVPIEDMQEIYDYCKNLGIADIVSLHDIEDKERVLKGKEMK